MKYDFGGYVTKNDLKCTDGRVIRHGAFKDCDGKRVPLVYQHQHRELDNVLGFVDLENRDDGVYGYGSFNETPQGQTAKAMVQHGDLTHMSIYANQLQERAKEVFHGVIREVSLVLSGANPGAVIDNLNLVHSDGTFELIDDEANIRPGIALEFTHAEDEEGEEEEMAGNENQNASSGKTVQDVVDAMTPEKRKALELLIGLSVMQAEGEDISDVVDAAAEEQQGQVQHADGSDKTLQEVFDTFTEEEKKVAYFLIGQAIKDAENNAPAEEEYEEDDEEVAQSDEEGVIMHNNVFEQGIDTQASYLSHDDMADIFHEARTRFGSLKDAWESFASEHEIDSASLAHSIVAPTTVPTGYVGGIEAFFPEAQAVTNQPAMVTRRMEWVAGVLAGVHKTPFSKVKSNSANLTADEARAKGYIKGRQKVEEQITALKRVTSPTTVYKLQKLDRDDVVDITDFDVVAWMKAEMRLMLDEEVARAFLIGDGRIASSNDKIDESCIRPIWTDDEVYAIHSVAANSTDRKIKAENFIDAAIEAQDDYKGSGSPTLYIGNKLLTSMRLMRNQIGERLYKNDQELADELRVSKIVPIEQFNGLTRTVDGKELELGGIIVNLADYNVGTNQGGQVSMFDDFDLNFNKLEFLIETRMSAALVQPASALVIEFGDSSASE